MVQYKSSSKGAEYWKLAWHIRKPRPYVNKQLDELDFKINSSTGGHRLAELISRAERGLISYEKCNMDELKAFCAARRIQGVDPKSRKKRDYIAVLEHADDGGASFNRFLDLPAELRVRICSYYMESLGYCSWSIQACRPTPEIVQARLCQPPPITQVCTVMRKETMPMFFDIFRLQFEDKHKHMWPKVLENDVLHLAKGIKKLSLHAWITVSDRTASSSDILYRIDVNMATRHKPATHKEADVSHFGSFNGQKIGKTLGPIIEQEVSRFLDTKQDEAGGFAELTKETCCALGVLLEQIKQQVQASLR